MAVPSRSVDDGGGTVLLARFVPYRLRHLTPEATAFAAIGVGNLVLYFLVFNALIFVGAVQATVIATLVTTYLAYLANRHWTYRDRPKRTVRREYTLFFAVNMAGLLVQAAGTGLLKYCFGLDERQHQLVFNIMSAACICVATVFRFWTYRTFVFKGATDESDFAEADIQISPTGSDYRPTAVRPQGSRR